jgi:hypothetical protein
LGRAAGGASLLVDVSTAGASEAESSAFVGAGSLVSLDSTGAGFGAMRILRAGAGRRSTDKLSSSTTTGALLAAGAGGSLACLSLTAFTVGAGATIVAGACGFGCFKLRTSEAPAADAVTHTTKAIHAESQRGRSRTRFAARRLASSCSLGRSLVRATGAGGSGEGEATATGTAGSAGGGGDGRGEGIGVASALFSGSCAERGKGLRRAADEGMRGVARKDASGFSKANSKVASGRS